MPLIKAVVGGALAGLGEGITRDTEHKRNLEGVRLREKYIMDRMQSQQKFQGEQGGLDRDLKSSENEQNRLSREGIVADQLVSRESEGQANRDQRGTMHDDRIAVSEKRQKTLDRQVDAAVDNYKSLDTHRKASMAQSLKESAARSEANKLKMEASNRPKKMTEDQAREEARKQTAEADEYGDPHPNREKEVAFYNVWERTGKFPDEITLTVDDLKASMRNSGMSLEEVVEGLTKRFYVIPISLQRRALRDPDIKSMMRTGGASNSLTPPPEATGPPVPATEEHPHGMVGRMH